jgi:hypothetical protein
MGAQVNYGSLGWENVDSRLWKDTQKGLHDDRSLIWSYMEKRRQKLD